MDAGSVVSSLSVGQSFDFQKRSAGSSGRMVHKKWSGGSGGRAGCAGDSRRASLDIYQRSEISTGTDLSAERPNTRDTTTILMRDASVLSGQPDKSNFREKLQSWTVYEDTSTPYVAPRPTTSLANQKPGSQLDLMTDIEREMSFLMSRPSTSFPVKPKELIEPLDGLLPQESPVSQKKFLVLPSIGHRHSGLFLPRQRSNLETINQLDYSRNKLEHDVDFFSDFYHQRQTIGEDVQESPPHFVQNPRDSPTKSGKLGTPMPLPPIHKLRWERLRSNAGLAGLEEENLYGQFSRGDTESHLTSLSSDDEDDLDQFRLKTPETFRSDSPAKCESVLLSPPLTPPPGFR